MSFVPISVSSQALKKQVKAWKPTTGKSSKTLAFLLLLVASLSSCHPLHDMLKLLESLGCGYSVVFARLLASKNILLQRSDSLSCYPPYLAHFKWDVHSLFFLDLPTGEMVLLLVCFYKI